MKLLSFVLIPCTLLQCALAADCSGQKWIVKDNEWRLWDMRERMCGNKDCGYQQDCSLASATYLAYGANTGFGLKRWKSDGKKGFGNCWVSNWLACYNVSTSYV